MGKSLYEAAAGIERLTSGVGFTLSRANAEGNDRDRHERVAIISATSVASRSAFPRCRATPGATL
jgi:hypothetical protein